MDRENRSIKAVQTRYAHHLFRSRLEAKWAVFFDAIGLQWDYETEGFELFAGMRYLPDFHFPQVHWFAEIKPNLTTFLVEDKARHFATHTGLPILVMAGPPSFKPYFGLAAENGVGLVSEFYSLDVARHDKALSEGRLWSDPPFSVYPPEENFSRRYIDAVEAALAARFE